MFCITIISNNVSQQQSRIKQFSYVASFVLTLLGKANIVTLLPLSSNWTGAAQHGARDRNPCEQDSKGDQRILLLAWTFWGSNTTLLYPLLLVTVHELPISAQCFCPLENVKENQQKSSCVEKSQGWCCCCSKKKFWVRHRPCTQGPSAGVAFRKARLGPPLFYYVVAVLFMTCNWAVTDVDWSPLVLFVWRCRWRSSCASWSGPSSGTSHGPVSTQQLMKS